MDTMTTAAAGHRAAAAHRVSGNYARHRPPVARNAGAMFRQCEFCSYEVHRDMLFRGICTTCRMHRVEMLTGRPTRYG